MNERRDNKCIPIIFGVRTPVSVAHAGVVVVVLAHNVLLYNLVRGHKSDSGSNNSGVEVNPRKAKQTTKD